MGGGLMQLVAYGAQDIYLTGNPQITFFKVVYRRHTNFSMEAIQQTLEGDTDLGKTVSCTISRNGDLVYKMYLEHSFHYDHPGDSDGPDDCTGMRERYGHSLIKECSIDIGGQMIDRHPALWHRVYSDLTEVNPTGYFGGNVTDLSTGHIKIQGTGTLSQLMTNNTYSLNANLHEQDFFGGAHTNGNPGGPNMVNGVLYTDEGANGGVVGHIFLPLNFWFTKNPGLALPLIALQYHEVKVSMTFEHEDKMIYTVNDNSNNGIVGEYDRHTNNHETTFKLWADYIYLDTDERRRFAQVSHEYLIEQLQYQTNTISSPTTSIDLIFNHPIKELIWCSKSIGVNGRNNTLGNISKKTKGREDPTTSEVSLDQMGGNWKIKLNGHDRFKERDSKYFTRSQVWQHHSGYGALQTRGIYALGFAGFTNASHILGPDASITKEIGGDSIAVYSFALKPEEHQPSGTCNFSRIDSAQLIGRDLKIGTSVTKSHTPVSLSSVNVCELTIFAVNYNVLRIMSGMGGLAYSN